MRSLSRRELGRPLTPPFPRRRGARGDCEAMRVDDFDFDELAAKQMNRREISGRAAE